MSLAVGYETAVGCVGSPVFVFAESRSPEIPVQIGSARCPGDCDLDGAVTIDELTRLVGLAVQGAVADACYAGDVDGDHFLSIAELIQAVGRALGGCGDGQS